jgi:hypothetical protein
MTIVLVVIGGLLLYGVFISIMALIASVAGL